MHLSNLVHARGLDFAEAMSTLARAYDDIDSSAKGVIPSEGVLFGHEAAKVGSDGDGSEAQQKKDRESEVSTSVLSGAANTSRSVSLAFLVQMLASNSSRDVAAATAVTSRADQAQYELLPSRALFLTLALASVVNSAQDVNKGVFLQPSQASQTQAEQTNLVKLTDLQLDAVRFFSETKAAAAIVAQISSLPLGATDDLLFLLKAISGFVEESVQKIAEAFGKGYVTFLNQLEENYEAFAAIIDAISSPAGFKLSEYLLEIDMPEGPRTPSFNLPLLGAGVDGDTNTIRILDVDNLSIFGSLSQKGDPSDTNPDQNDIAGQVEANLAGLLVGANFQNGVYVGAYTPETESSEAHHQFQTGMVDQSGPYAFGERLDSLNALSINPEADRQNDNLIVGDLIPFDVSVEGISAFLDSQESEYVIPKTDFKTYEEILDGVLKSSEFSPSELGFDISPEMLELATFESIDLDSILSVASKIEIASTEAAEMITGLQADTFDLTSYLGGLKGFGPSNPSAPGQSLLGDNGAI